MLLKNEKYCKSAKHMDIKYLFIKKKMLEQRVLFEHIGTETMLVDPLTKKVLPKIFVGHVEAL